MRKYLYCYQTTVRFDAPVLTHAIKLRCQPCQCAFQNIEEEHFIISPQFWKRRGTDIFGNRLIFGGTKERHESLAYVSTGIVSVGEYVIPDDSPAIYYKYPTELTRVAAEVVALHFRKGNTNSTMGIVEGNALDTAMSICHKVHELIEYAPATTDNTTTAQDVLDNHKGVCQDYAHVMIACCRQMGIATRYVCGFLEGVGATHAWVEIHDGYAWRGIDPTNDILIEQGYIKLAHGRDANDCPVNRGTFQGCANQQTYFNVTAIQI